LRRITLERVPKEVEEAEGEQASGAEYDGDITVDGAKP